MKLAGGDRDSVRAKDRKLTTEDLPGDRITAEEMQHHYGRAARKRQHEQFKEGKSSTQVRPEDSPQVQEEARSFDSRKMYFGPGERIGDSPIFSEKYDFLQVKLHQNLDDNQLKKLSELMKKSGMSNDQVGRALFGGEHFIKKALGASIGEEDPVSERRMNEVVEHLRSESEGFGRQMVLPTRVGKNRPDPTYVGGAKQVSIGRFAHLTDRLDAIQTVEGAVERIHQFAEELNPQSKQDLKRLKAKAEQELQDPDVSSAFREVSQAFGAVLRQNVDKMAGHLGEVSARYMGGEYKVAMPQTRIMPKMRELHGAADLSGTAPNQQFRDTVEKMLRNAKPHAAGTEGFDDAVESASKDLFKYIRQQDNRFGEEITEWQGMGVSEGFINRSEAQKVLDEMKTRHQAGSEHANQIVEEATNLQGSAQKKLRELQELEQLEIERLSREIDAPGSTSGALGMMTRQPDFQAIGGYEMGRHTALGRQAMYAMGMDPDQINTMSNPLASFSRGEDFDMDLNYRAMLEDPAIAGHMREKANHTPDQLLALHRILEQMDPNSKKVSEGPSTSFSRASSYEEEIYIDTGKGDQRQRVKTDVRRVTTNVESGAETFDQPVGAYFGYSGSALQAQMSGPEAREAYSLQQSIVGSFGAYSKQGAIQTRQRVNAFNDIMTRMEGMIAEEEEARAAASTADTGRAASADVARNATEMAFRESFRTPSQVSRLRSMEGNVIQNPWEFMKQTFKDTADAQRAHPNMPFSPLHTATLAEQAITQTAIEKYKKAGALEEAKRLHNISSTLHGNHKGGYQGFDDAIGALLDEEIRGHQVTDYFKGADEEIGRNVAESELEDRARKAFRLQYNRNISMQMIEQAGMATDSYQQFGSSMSVGDMDPAEKVAAGLRERGRFMGEGGGVQQMQAVMDFLQGDDTQRAMQSFASAENYFQSRIQSIMDRPATYKEKFTNALGNLPHGAKAAGLGGLVGLAGLALMDDPQTEAGGEEHDFPVEWPQPDIKRGTARTGARMLESRNKARIEALYANKRERPAGREHRMRKPPPVRASY